MLQTSFLQDEIVYDGSQLVTHWPRNVTGLTGDCIVAFLGPAEVPTENLVDLEDRCSGESIIAKRMLHFIGVRFGRTLTEMVLRQRLYVLRIAERLRRRNIAALVDGDDLYVPGAPGGRRKLSVSIATVSPLAGLIHIGLNVDPSGAPVPAVGLKELEVNAFDFGKEMLELFAREEREIIHAASKVRAVD